MTEIAAIQELSLAVAGIKVIATMDLDTIEHIVEGHAEQNPVIRKSTREIIAICRLVKEAYDKRDTTPLSASNGRN